MARYYGNTATSIWRDDDFLALPSDLQRTYWMLFTQPDISPCGILAMTLKRWSQKASDTTIESLSKAIAMLCEANFLAVDEDSEELLVRTFVKWDGGYKVPNRLKAIITNANAIQSRTLLQVVASELDKLGVKHDLLANPSERLSKAIGKASRMPFESNMVVVTTNVSSEQPTTHNQTTGGGKPSPSDDVPPPGVCSKHPDGTESPCRACGIARKKREKWDIEKRNAANEFAKYLDSQPECPHGISGGDIDRPNIGTPSCAQCRRLRSVAS